MAFSVRIDGGYGDPDGSIHLLDDAGLELVMWDATEWIEDPSLVFVIANAIQLGFTHGAFAVRARGIHPVAGLGRPAAPSEDQLDG